MPTINIDLNEPFPTLKAAPSIEAVIHWQAHASKKLEPEGLKSELGKQLPDYSDIQTQKNIQMGFEAPDGAPAFFQNVQWNGLRLHDVSGHHVAQFTPRGIVFSRLQPYESWETFEAEAIRVWDVFLELAEPKFIQRLGLRYINRIILEDGSQPSEYLKIVPPALPGLELPTEAFFHQETYKVSGYPYHIQWVRTIQPADLSKADKPALIVDIDVFVNELLQLEQESLIRMLREMRWLKNKVFFSCITESALERFGVSPNA